MSLRLRRAARCHGSIVTMVVLAGIVGVWTDACGAAMVRRGDSSAAFAGVYVTTPPLLSSERGIPDAVYRLPQVDGIYIRLVWNVVEPVRDKYNWSTLDAQLDRALPAGKKLAIGIGTGAFTPDWVYKLGAPGAIFVIAPHGGRNNNCRTVKMPAPWATQYQNAFGDLMAALAAHLKARPGAYQAARIIKMTAINEHNEETKMGVSNGQKSVPGGCSQSDAVSTWRSLGYRPSKVFSAWSNMANAVDRAFPDKLIAMPILEKSGFPPIDESGQLTSSNVPAASDIKRELILAGLKIFDGHFAVQWNGLQINKVSQSVLWAGTKGAVIGWQTNEHGGRDGAACGTPSNPKTPCTEAGYEAILSRGIDSGAQYLEIWPPDASKFPSAVGRASVRLRSGGNKPASVTG